MLEEGDGLKVLVRGRLHEEHDLRSNIFLFHSNNWSENE
jgi:hypothetical protein